jgi:hypothetical protein
MSLEQLWCSFPLVFAKMDGSLFGDRCRDTLNITGELAIGYHVNKACLVFTRWESFVST